MKRSYEELSSYLDSVGKYTKVEKKALYERYTVLQEKYLTVIDEFLKTKELPNLEGGLVPFFTLYENMNYNVLQAVCTFAEIEQNPEYAEIFRSGLDEVESDIEFVIDYCLDDKV